MINSEMNAFFVTAAGAGLVQRRVPVPEPGPGEVLLKVDACGVCRTDLHILDGDLVPPAYPVVPGHEIVGRVVAVGRGVSAIVPGRRVGVPWLGETCRCCSFCLDGRENLCDHPRFTGFHNHGGFAEYAVARARFCFSLPSGMDDLHAAPLLCAGLIGFRAWRLAKNPRNLGLYGFGAAAHILCQLATSHGCSVYAFTRKGDEKGQDFARMLGAVWAGDSTTRPPVPLDAAIIFAPVGGLVVAALRAVAKGGRVVCAGIHMSDIPAFPYRYLWEERQILSVANLTRADGELFFQEIATHPVTTHVHPFPLSEANRAVEQLQAGLLKGAAVLVP